MARVWDWVTQRAYASQAERYQLQWYDELLDRGHRRVDIEMLQWRDSYDRLCRLPLRQPTMHAGLGRSAAAWKKALAKGKARYVEPNPFRRNV